MNKACTKCLKVKAFSAFYSGRPDCAACVNARSRMWSKNNPGGRKAQRARYAARHPGFQEKARLKRVYGIDWEKFQALSKSQNDACAICGVQPKKLFIDHDHATGKFRALLCILCNSMLGMAKDSQGTLLAAAKYLEQHK